MLVQWVQLTSTSLQNIVMKAFLWTFVSQLRNTLLLNAVRCFFCAFYIKSQHPMPTINAADGYFFCAFYIKSQHLKRNIVHMWRYFFCAFYIKSQLSVLNNWHSVVISFAHSTSNHNDLSRQPDNELVISFAHSTSNHNIAFNLWNSSQVISFAHSTSNHN